MNVNITGVHSMMKLQIKTKKVPILVIHNYFEPELISNNNNPRVQIMVCNFVELEVHEIDAKLLHTSTVNMLVFSNSMWIEPLFLYCALLCIKPVRQNTYHTSCWIFRYISKTNC